MRCTGINYLHSAQACTATATNKPRKQTLIRSIGGHLHCPSCAQCAHASAPWHSMMLPGPERANGRRKGKSLQRRMCRSARTCCCVIQQHLIVIFRLCCTSTLLPGYTVGYHTAAPIMGCTAEWQTVQDDLASAVDELLIWHGCTTAMHAPAIWAGYTASLHLLSKCRWVQPSILAGATCVHANTRACLPCPHLVWSSVA